MFAEPSFVEKLSYFLKTQAFTTGVLTSVAATVISAVATLAAKLFSSDHQIKLRKSSERDIQVSISRGESWSSTGGHTYHDGWSKSTNWPANVPEDPSQHRLSPWEASRAARGRVSARLKEAGDSLERQSAIENRSKFASNALTVTQYIIGGLLASSFIQQSLDPKVVGALGVLVLVASLIKQHFHPETDAEEARRKGLQLQAFIRQSEDEVAILDAKILAGQDHSDAMVTLMKDMTRRLTEIETPEINLVKKDQ